MFVTVGHLVHINDAQLYSKKVSLSLYFSLVLLSLVLTETSKHLEPNFKPLHTYSDHLVKIMCAETRLIPISSPISWSTNGLTLLLILLMVFEYTGHCQLRFGLF